MAWGSQGMVFLGEDLMHSRDYSEDTSRVIDEEVERILREQEERAFDVLSSLSKGLKAVANALLEKETIDGDEVSRLVDQATGKVVSLNKGSVLSLKSAEPTQSIEDSQSALTANSSSTDSESG